MYDDPLTDRDATLRTALDFLGIRFAGEIPNPQTLKVADDRSKEWIEEFMRLEAADPIAVDPAPEMRWAVV